MAVGTVRERLGAPLREETAGDELRLVYDDCTIVFRNGRVTNVTFG